MSEVLTVLYLGAEVALFVKVKTEASALVDERALKCAPFIAPDTSTITRSCFLAAIFFIIIFSAQSCFALTWVKLQRYASLIGNNTYIYAKRFSIVSLFYSSVQCSVLQLYM